MTQWAIQNIKKLPSLFINCDKIIEIRTVLKDVFIF